MGNKDRYRILVTRPLTEKQRALAENLGLDPVEIPALRVEEPVSWEPKIRKISGYRDAIWIFTSKNAVRSLEKMREQGLKVPDRQVIYAVGEKTAEALSAAGLKASYPDREDATGLAMMIVSDLQEIDVRPNLLHWSGNRPRPELKTTLGEYGYPLIRVEVYSTHLNAMKLPGERFRAVLFFSPSAVEAFRKSGGFGDLSSQIQSQAQLFAVGNTTGETLSLEAGENVHIPARASVESVLALTADILGKESAIDEQDME